MIEKREHDIISCIRYAQKRRFSAIVIKIYVKPEFAMNKDLCDTVFSVIYGGIIGDALGVPYWHVLCILKYCKIF